MDASWSGGVSPTIFGSLWPLTSALFLDLLCLEHISYLKITLMGICHVTVTYLVCVEQVASAWLWDIPVTCLWNCMWICIVAWWRVNEVLVTLTILSRSLLHINCQIFSLNLLISNRPLCHHQILPVSHDISWSVQQFELLLLYKAVITDCWLAWISLNNDD